MARMMMRSWVGFLLALSIGGSLPAAGVVINEIHYKPFDQTKLEEFVELYSVWDGPIDLSGWYFSSGITYTFPEGTTLAPGEFLVVAENPAALAARYALTKVLGPFEGRLSNEGENLVLRNRQGGKEDEVDYKVAFPWPSDSAGDGGSLELIHPFLDNGLGGSWRASTGSRSLPVERVTYIASGAEWRYRKGTEEASDPPAAWREIQFTEDDSWLVAPTNIGFGDNNKTVLSDMNGGYTSVYLRRPFDVVPLVAGGAAPPPWLRLRLFVDDGCIVWINGKEVARRYVTAGDKAFNATAQSHEARWEELLLENTAAYLVEGVNVIAIHAFNQSLTSNDFSIDAELIVPARSELPAAASPGAQNSAFAENAPPQARQVDHSPQEPRAGDPITVTAKVTDPEGVASVSLKYQVVQPGKFIPAFLAHEPSVLMARPDEPRPPNPAFENPQNWTPLPMLDDGAGEDLVADDGIYTAVIPGQPNRTLVRYRLTVEDVEGASARLPYPDDRSLNFACFVYDGVPPYRATKISTHPEGKGHVYPPEVLESLPTYFLLTRSDDVARCVAYNGAWQLPKSNEKARDAFNWEGAFVYQGIVYDHIRYRLRQANDRYGGGGKRSWRIRFNRGHRLVAHDNQGQQYPTRWRTLNTGKMFDNKGVGNFGVTETINNILWNMVGAPAPFQHTFHLRVVDGVDEAPATANEQYHGDFWGMAVAIEDYDPRFLEAHGMPDGNLYKLKDGIFDGKLLRRNQGRYAVTTDADFQNIRTSLRPERPPDWLNMHVNYDRWNPYHAVVEAIRHYDFVPADSHSKNRAWFFEPEPGNKFGRLWTLPHDADASWGPNWNDGVDYSKNAIATGPTKADFRIRYRNTIREFRDLLWQPDVIKPMIDDTAAIIREFHFADRDRWRGAPQDAGSQDFGTLDAKLADMKRFAFDGWSGPTGPTVPPGGRAKHLDNLSVAEGDTNRIPETPEIVAVGPSNFPLDNLVFEATPFVDPQPADTFAAMKWRVGEVTDPAAPFDPAHPRIYEWKAVLESEELTEFQSRITIPVGVLHAGHTYRARVKLKDSTGRWSHWSPPVEFKAGPPDGPLPVLSDLRVTEIMYNPSGGGDYEFIEIANVGQGEVDLTGVKFTRGIEFSFDESPVTRLGPGEYAVVVKSLDLFRSRYDGDSIRVAGEYSGKLDNQGEEIDLNYKDLAILKFTFSSAWYATTDGEGYSLVAADPHGSGEVWSTPDGWKAGDALHGTPGAADGGAAAGLQRPGDFNQSGTLNISDAILLLRHLVLGGQQPMPCEGGAESRANRLLLDLDGDLEVGLTDAVNLLHHLFLGAPPPALGDRCVRISGCPSACTQ